MLLAPPAAPAIAAAAKARTTCASVSSKGKQATSRSILPALSASGRHVAFESGAANLVKRDKNFVLDVFVRDRTTGKTERVSVSSSGKQGNAASGFAAISADGRFVAFTSSATNLVAGDTNDAEDVFVHDRTTHTTERISVGSAGEEADGDSAYPAISADGRFVSFKSIATNLVEDDSNGYGDAFVHDRETGTTTRVSVSSSGDEGNGFVNYMPPGAISADGRLVTFSSTASNLVEDDANEVADVFVHDRDTGVTRRASVSTAGVEANAASVTASVSANGRFVVFHSPASNLVADDTNDRTDVFAHDLETGTTTRVSVGRAGAEADGASFDATTSAGGRFVAFQSEASNLVDGDGNGASDVFVHDREKGRTRRVSVGPGGAEGNGPSERPSISADGKFVAFESSATTLIVDDRNDDDDVYVRGRLR